MLDTTPIQIAAPLVATTALLLFLRARRSPYARRVLGPAADVWELVRRGLLPLLDRFLRRQDGDHYASYELGEQEIVGLVDAPSEEVEQMLWEAGATRMPLAALKRLSSGGRTEVGSWAWRDGLLAREQVHVMLFRAKRDGETLVAAHKEPNALNPATALDHYRGRGLDADAGERAVRERLDEGVWVEA